MKDGSKSSKDLYFKMKPPHFNSLMSALMTSNTCQWRQRGRKWRGDPAWGLWSSPSTCCVYGYIPVCPRTLYLLGRPSPISVETQKCSWVRPADHWLCLITKQEPPSLHVGLMYTPQQPQIQNRWIAFTPPSPQGHTAVSGRAQRTPRYTWLQGQHKSIAIKIPRALRPLVCYASKGWQ